jgi:hypothetical protein
MAIPSVSASNAAIAVTPPAQPTQNVSEAQLAAEQQSNNKGAVGNLPPPPPPPPKPTVNTKGETIGTLVNVTA